MKEPDLTTQIAIVGGGMVGLTLALSLVRNEATQHVSVMLIEAGTPVEEFHGAQFDPRVVALSEASIQQLQKLDVWPMVVGKRACPYSSMSVWDGEGTGNIQFHARDLHRDTLGYIVENSVLVRSLAERVRSSGRVRVLDRTTVVGIEVQGSVHEPAVVLSLRDSSDSTLTLNADLVIAADGARSQLRELAGFATREWDYGHAAIVTTVEVAASHEHTCWQRFTQDGPIALLPLQKMPGFNRADSHYCSLVWSAKTSLAQELMALEDGAFCQALARAFEYRLGEIKSVQHRVSIPLRQRHAKTYTKPGIALVGDAAHTIHPLAGQGVNLGYYDVAALTAEIARASERQIPLTDGSILRRYQRARQTHNLAAMASMEGFKRLFGADNLPLRWLRNQGMTFVNNQFLLKKQLAKIAAGQLSG
ncbi:2-octaprenyl-3-methyl-6-methoxy-1,4-benzoquinol hydroxylase [Teredinibacter turnerae T7901]|uniref:2-octaprenyl-3-methyl-6-methoxy-1,4-benzoquinol hydroxylase n=1 Tax=Teredinibacter turnerae (strain ATCC 39867 / T7901) TaxID=377629 RepID=C5BMD9_TERTT|nr:FAD-dependent monooxygenase [Teredinibacter turnerae]ACR11407.1 2-octaprenyl-3-methyl-6-methoxy-1,4-benzoquinol hydroxylase [Teredinibacter turnerae T7901]